MKTHRKVRGDAVLKNLTARQQRALFLRLNRAGGTLCAVRKWLAGQGIHTSRASISEFYDWYSKRNRGTRPPSALQFDNVSAKLDRCLDLLQQMAPKRPIRRKPASIEEVAN